jgi:uncharacterized protein
MDPRLLSYLYYFNVAHDYYECHEYCESLWFATGRPKVLKGLIQSAVCLFHLFNGNVRGGWQMWQRAKQYLQLEIPVYQGIDLAKLITDIDEVFARVPNAWLTQRVHREDIISLDLPTVHLHFVDQTLDEMVKSWVPTPLEEST